MQDSENSTKIRTPKCQLIAVVLHNQIGTTKKHIMLCSTRELQQPTVTESYNKENTSPVPETNHEHRLNQLFADYLPRKLFF